jgi:hypothetical protein
MLNQTERKLTREFALAGIERQHDKVKRLLPVVLACHLRAIMNDVAATRPAKLTRDTVAFNDDLMFDVISLLYFLACCYKTDDMEQLLDKLTDSSFME